MAEQPHSSSTDDLDELLDSALDDFHSLNLKNQRPTKEPKQEKESVSALGGVQGLGLGLPDLKPNKPNKPKPKQPRHHASEAVEKLREHTKEAIKGLDSVTNQDPLIDDWVKQFEDLAASQDMESIMETMMQQLLSKEILHEPMKEIAERYPKWLEENHNTLTKHDYDRFSNQYALITSLNQVYDNDPTNFTKIVELMHKMQECGQPPNDLLTHLAPDFDLASLAQLSPEMLDPQNNNCCVM